MRKAAHFVMGSPINPTFRIEASGRAICGVAAILTGVSNGYQLGKVGKQRDSTVLSERSSKVDKAVVQGRLQRRHREDVFARADYSQTRHDTTRLSK